MKKMILIIFLFGVQSAWAMDAPVADSAASINLFAIIQQGDAAAVRQALASGASANTVAGLSGYTVLMQAAESHNPEVVQALIQAKACLNAKWHRRTALDMAVTKGHLDIVTVLRAAGADMNPITLAALVDLPSSDDESVEKIAGTKEL